MPGAQSPHAPDAAADEEIRFSLVRDDVAFRLQRAAGLIPREGLGIARRAIFFALFTWLPIALWAAAAGRAVAGEDGEALVQQFGIHARFLVALPLLIICEGSADRLMIHLVPHFERSGVVPEAERDRFRRIVRRVSRIRGLSLPWMLIAAVVFLWTALRAAGWGSHELAWAANPRVSSGGVGFGGWWLLYVARPIFSTFVCAWIWRLILLLMLLMRVSRLPLAIVPTHPDRAGGLGFLEAIPSALSPFALAVSTVIASHWAHDVVYHGVAVKSLELPVAVSVAAVVLLCLAPLVVFAGPLKAARRHALLDYGTLVGARGRLVRRRWILRDESARGDMLEAPELGPVADTNALYEAVKSMRIIPLGRRAVLAVAWPTLLPMVALFAQEIPLKTVLLKILKALV